MSLINEYRATEEAIKELQERLKNLSQDDKLKKELEFEECDMEEETGWKLVHGEVLRQHPYPLLLSVSLGTGTQLL